MQTQTRWAAGLFLLLVLQLPRPGLAVNCNDWKRMGPGQRSATIDRMIDSAISGSRGRQYRVDRVAVARCLEGNARSIEYDFDGACADSRTASMQALNRIFKDYIWSCAG
jgi:hypothetical protein